MFNPDDVELLAYQEPIGVDQRISRDRYKRMQLKKLCVIADTFLRLPERAVLDAYLHYGDATQVLAPLVRSGQKYLVRHKIKMVLRLVRRYIDFFLRQDYKTIDRICRSRLKPAQYELLRLYLKLRSYGACGTVYGVTWMCIKYRLQRIEELLVLDDRVKPLLDLLAFLRKIAGTHRSGYYYKPVKNDPI